MKTLFRILVLISLPLTGNASENSLDDDYSGKWVTHSQTSVKGEKQVLVINNDHSTYFERSFDNVLQKFNSSGSEYTQQEDILIIKYYDTPKALRYKLVLSGWKSGDTLSLYGTMYMYREGKQFNGLPISFRKQ